MEEFGEVCLVIILIVSFMFLTVILCSFTNKQMEKESIDPKYQILPEPSFERPEVKKPPKLYYQVINGEKENKARLERYYESLEI